MNAKQNEKRTERRKKLEKEILLSISSTKKGNPDIWCVGNFNVCKIQINISYFSFTSHFANCFYIMK